MRQTAKERAAAKPAVKTDDVEPTAGPVTLEERVDAIHETLLDVMRRVADMAQGLTGLQERVAALEAGPQRPERQADARAPWWTVPDGAKGVEAFAERGLLPWERECAVFNPNKAALHVVYGAQEYTIPSRVLIVGVAFEVAKGWDNWCKNNLPRGVKLLEVQYGPMPSAKPPERARQH